MASCNGIPISKGRNWGHSKEKLDQRKEGWNPVGQAPNPVVPCLVLGLRLQRAYLGDSTPGFAVFKMHLSFGLVLLFVCSSEAERRICGRIDGEDFETRAKGLQIQMKSRLREVELSVVFTAGEGVCNMLCLLAESLAQSLLIAVM